MSQLNADSTLESTASATVGERVELPRAIRSLPPRTAVLQAEIELAKRQLDGYIRVVRVDGEAVGEEIEEPAQGETRRALLAEIDRLERHLQTMTTPVLMPDLVLGTGEDQ